MQILDGVIERNELNEKSNGGTELMTEGLVKHVPKEHFEGVQIIVSRQRNELLPDKHKIYYSHDLPGDPEAQKILSNNGWANFHKLVFVSYWQQQHFIEAYGIPWSKTTVLKNAITPVTVDVKKKFEKKKDQYNIVYHTTPHRGLKLLIPAFNHLQKNRDDVHLHLYSSFGIYGWEKRDEQFQQLFEQAKNTPNVTVHKTLPNEEMKKVLADMDVFAYPSIWPETSCISLMEAMSAGCLCVHPSYAALPETSANWTMMYDFHEDEQTHANHFYSFLHHALEYIDNDKNNSSLITKLMGQKSYVDLYYNWEVRKMEWIGLLTGIKKMELELAGPDNVGFGDAEFSYST